MEDDEDDLYGTTEPAADNGAQIKQSESGINTIKPELDEDEEEDSDDDIEFTLERPETTKQEPSTKTAVKAETTDSATPQPAKRARTSAPAKAESTEPQPLKSVLSHNGKEGKDYPEVRTSSVDLDADPTWPADDKKITDVDIDADLAEHSKPWRLPGTDQTDFFNYGFDEYTWTQYCARQKNMTQTIGELKDEDSKMKAMLGGMPSDGNMPDMAQMMQMMMGGGMPDPSKMDFNQMSQMMGMGMPGMPGMPTGGFPGQQGSGSPMAQGGQGFQMPSGPSAQQQSSMDGYSSQQMAMMQQEQQGGGGSGRRGRRGRGGFNY